MTVSIPLKEERRLLLLSGNICAFPGCNLHLFRPEEQVNIGERAHMVAQNEGGPRYDPDFPKDDLHTYSNLILFCCNHHTMVDQNAEKYTLAFLRTMKSDHEARIRAIATGPSWKVCCADLAEFFEYHVETKFHEYWHNPARGGERQRLTREEMGGEKSDEVDGYWIDRDNLLRLYVLAKAAQEIMKQVSLRSTAAYRAVREIVAWTDKAYRQNECSRCYAQAHPDLAFSYSRKVWFDKIEPGLKPPAKYIAVFNAASAGPG